MFITYTSTGSYRAEDGQGLLTQALGWAGDGVSVQQCKDEPSHHDVPAPRSHEPSSEGQDSEEAAEGIPLQELHFLLESKRPWESKMSKDVLTDLPPDLA